MNPTPETPASGLTDVVLTVLANHLYDGCTEPACDPGSDPEACVRRPFLNHLAERVAAAVAQARAEDRAHIEAVEKWAETWLADWTSRPDRQRIVELRAALTATEDGHRP